MLECTPNMWKRPPRESFETQKAKVLAFGEQWRAFDWTAQLQGESL